MNLKRQLAAVGGALALVAAGASVALIGGAASSDAAESPSSAFGLQATGLLPIDATPTVTSKDGKLTTDSLIAIPNNPLLSGGVVNVQAQNDAAEADVANLTVGGGLLSQLTGQLSALTTQLQPVCDALKNVPLNQLNNAVTSATGALDLGALTNLLNTVGGAAGIDLSLVSALDLSKLLPDDLSGLCDVLDGSASLVGAGAITTECHGTTGSVNVVDLKALGLPINIDTNKPNASISIPGVLTIEANRQTKNADGTFTVDGLVVDLLGQAEIVLTSATCGHVTTARHTSTTDAPTPHPVHTKAPVTG